MAREEKHIPKTNPVRILEQKKVDFKILQYRFDEDNLDAVHAASELGLPCEQVFKTIVMRNNENKIFVFCLPANATVSLKKARAVTLSSEINPVKPSELMSLTGYIRGGCSPLGMKKQYPTFFDETVVLFDKIAISGGMRGINLFVNGEELASLISAKIVSITQD